VKLRVLCDFVVKDKMFQTLEILDIGTNGDGIARDDRGQTVFIPLTAPGDVVEAEVDKDGRGRLLKILQSSPHRVPQPCRHFGICGGCSLQHIDEETYKKFKRDTVLSVLKKEGIELPENIESIFIPDRTRRRANFAARVVKGKAIIGFHERRSSNIRDVPDCLLVTDEVRGVMEKFRPFIPDIAGEGNKIDMLIQCIEGGQVEIGLTGKIAPGWEAQQALSDALRATGASHISLRARDFENYKILLKEKPCFKHFGSLVVNLAPGAFLQPSAEGERTLTDCVIKGAGETLRIADLFCGNGTFTGPLMKGRNIISADFAPDSIAELKKAGVDARLRNLFKEPFTAEELQDRDCVILDPPRAGAQAQVRVLAETAIPRIVYVSCNPQSFAKDAKVLMQGGYTLSALTMIDQFIWSPHMELVGVFRR
jgi:23S rRNA (uracil1939-C5)-methyltransferase